MGGRFDSKKPNSTIESKLKNLLIEEEIIKSYFSLDKFSKGTYSAIDQINRVIETLYAGMHKLIHEPTNNLYLDNSDLTFFLKICGRAQTVLRMRLDFEEKLNDKVVVYNDLLLSIENEMASSFINYLLGGKNSTLQVEKVVELLNKLEVALPTMSVSSTILNTGPAELKFMLKELAIHLKADDQVVPKQKL